MFIKFLRVGPKGLGSESIFPEIKELQKTSSLMEFTDLADDKLSPAALVWEQCCNKFGWEGRYPDNIMFLTPLEADIGNTILARAMYFESMGKRYLVISRMQAYICNEIGRTIEKIG